MNPNGIPAFSPRLRRRGYLGCKCNHLPNPNVGCVCILSDLPGHNSFRVVIHCFTDTQSSSFLATLG
jgi:hypothetical protein